MEPAGDVPRRTFLTTSGFALLGLVVQDASQTALQRSDPIIDIHQHLNYSGRSDEVLLAHQRLMGATTTILLPAGRSVTTPSTHEGVSNGLQAEALGNEACEKFAAAHKAAYRFAANEVPDVAGCDQGDRTIPETRGPPHRRTEVRRRVRLAGDAADLPARPGATRSRS